MSESSAGGGPGRPLVLAHRGACRRARENTVEAFALARDLRADGVELDVRRTADGVCVVHHDAGVDGFGRFVERSFGEVREALPFVPTLDEALDACADLVVNVEVKCCAWEPDADPGRTVARHVVDVVTARDLFDRVVVSSFDVEHVDAVRAFDPRVVTALLTVGRDPRDAAPFAAGRGHAWLHPDRVATLADPEAAVRAAADAGVRLDVWTVDHPDELRALAAAGVDALITNVPDVALEVLALG